MKSYTDINQSKKLAEILPSDSADMARCGGENVIMTDYISAKKKFSVCGELTITPCWSLAALLRVIPKHIKDYNVLRIDISDNDFAIWYDEIGYGVNNELPNITEESAVDACVAMIKTLHELNLL